MNAIGRVINSIANQNRSERDRKGESRQKVRTASVRLPMPITSTAFESVQNSPELSAVSVWPHPLGVGLLTAVRYRRRWTEPVRTRRSINRRWRRRTEALGGEEESEGKTLDEGQKLEKT